MPPKTLKIESQSIYINFIVNVRAFTKWQHLGLAALLSFCHSQRGILLRFWFSLSFLCLAWAWVRMNSVGWECVCKCVRIHSAINLFNHTYSSAVEHFKSGWIAHVFDEKELRYKRGYGMLCVWHLIDCNLTLEKSEWIRGKIQNEQRKNQR